MRTPKFSFIPMQTKAKPVENSEPTLGIYKTGQMIFSRKAVTDFGLAGALIKFMYDPKNRAIAFRKMHGVPLDSIDDDIRKLDPKGKNQVVQTGIGRLLKLNGFEKGNYTGLKIDKYIDSMAGELYYVRLPKNTCEATSE